MDHSSNQQSPYPVIKSGVLLIIKCDVDPTLTHAEVLSFESFISCLQVRNVQILGFIVVPRTWILHREFYVYKWEGVVFKSEKNEDFQIPI